MSDERTAVEVSTTGPEYLGWRGELLAELALARVPGLTIFRDPQRRAYDFAVSTSDNFFFAVEVAAFSSLHLRIADVERIPELRWPVDAELVRRARQSASAVVLFLFDADTDHGRYSRLDALPAPERGTTSVMLRLPVENTITRQSLNRLVAELRGAHRRPLQRTAAEPAHRHA